MLFDVRRAALFATIPAFVLVLSLSAQAQSQALITAPVDDSQLVTLAGNTRAEAIAANDRGPVDDSYLVDHMFLQLRRSPASEAALVKLIDEMHDPSSANYHQWLSSAEFGQRFGLPQQDLNTISGWLKKNGFTVNVVYGSGVLIDFSGTAGQIHSAFHTEIHNLMVGGASHIANMSDPKIPAALAPAVAGVVSMHNFLPRPMYKPRAQYTVTSGTETSYLVVPADLATIYHLNPVFQASITGKGQTVVVIEDSNMQNTADWTSFRSVFGLNRFGSATFTTVHPASSGTNNCSNPGANGDDEEAELDAEYASASAPGAAIEMATCSSGVTFGGLIAIQNLINASATPPAIMSVSYGECEALNGASANASFNSTYQQAVAEGVSVFVSSGDDNAAGCDRDATKATHGIGVTGWGGTPYNVAVGGTDFGDSYAGTNTTYWNATNTQFFGSAKSYIPEIPWNDSCASVLISTIEGFATTYGSTGFCNSSTAKADGFLNDTGGSGGPSACATGSPATSGVVGGSCAGYAKPSWQTGVVGVPSDGVRDVPDVSLFAANGVWGHYYPICFSASVSCTSAPSTWPGAGGTSFSSPIMAGIQALVNQKNGSPQGNPNYVYYKLAAKEYGASGNASCNSTLGNTAASTCIFYDVTLGDMDSDCSGTHNCYKPSGSTGVLSTSNTAYQPAYGTNVGWDFSTGIGSVNAGNLVKMWGTVSPSVATQ